MCDPCSLSLPENVTQLIDYVVDDAPEGGDNKVEFIYPYKASEVGESPLSSVDISHSGRAEGTTQLLLTPLCMSDKSPW